MKRPSILVLFVAIVAVTGLVIRSALRRDEASRAGSDIARRIRALRAQIDTADIRLKRAGEACRALESEIAVTKSAATAPAPATSRTLSPQTVIANDPVKMAAYSRDYRAGLDLNYGGMVKALGLSPGQWERFKDFKLWEEQRRIDLRAAAENQGLDLRSPAFRALQQKDDAERAQKEREMLGDAMDGIREFDRTQYLRQITDRLASAGYMYPLSPLGADEIERVTQIIAQNTPRRRDGTIAQTPIRWAKVGPQLELPPAIMDVMQCWEPGLQARVEERTAQILAPLNAALPVSKRRNIWDIWYIDPVVPAGTTVATPTKP